MVETESKPRGEKMKLTKKGKMIDRVAGTLSRQEEKGVIYIGHLPWGFEESGLKEYFSQFGKVEKLRLARSKKTGRSKGYAFLKFAHDEVAKIAAETMDNYLMFGKLVKCKQIKDVHPKTFMGPTGPFEPMISKNAISKHNQEKSEARLTGNKRTAMKKYLKKIEILKKHGVNYELKDMEKMKAALTDKLLQKDGTQSGEEEEAMEEDISDTNQDSEDSEDVAAGDEGDVEMVEEKTLSAKKSIETKLSQQEQKNAQTPKTPAGKNKNTLKAQQTKETPKTGQKTPDAGKNTKTPNTLSNKTTPKAKLIKEDAVKTPKSIGKAGLRNKTPKNEIPRTVETPKGQQNVLIEDSSDEEISFRTPPQTIKSSVLLESKSLSTPRAQKRKLSSAKKSELKDIDNEVVNDAKATKKAKPEKSVGTPKNVEKLSDKKSARSVGKVSNKPAVSDDTIGTPIAHRMQLRTPKKSDKASLVSPKSLKQTPASGKRKKSK